MVETYQESVRSRGTNQQDLSVNATADAAGAGIGRAAQGLGAGVVDVGMAMAARNEMMSGNDARDAENAFIERARQLRYDPESGYLNQTGGNALQARADFERRLEQERSDIAGRLSPQARRIYERATDGLANGVREQFIRHEATQVRSYTNDTRMATADNYINEALLNYNNPELFEQNLARALAEQEQIARLNGMPPEAAAVARDKLVSSAFSGVVARMADEGVGGAVRAQQYLNDNIERFSADDRNNLRTALRPLVLRDQARVDVNEAVSTTGRAVERYDALSSSNTDMASREQAISALLHDGYANETRRRESGSTSGRLDAAPPINPATGRRPSSAKGPYQFIDGTWLAMVDRARASGGATWADGLSRAEILEYRWTGGTMRGRDGAVRAANDEMFIQFRLANQDALRRNGFAASPENEYLMHIFGEGGGMKVLRASPGAMMETVIGDTAARNNRLVGVTNGQYQRRLAAAYGAPGAPQAGPGGEYDFAGLYTQAVALMETDPERGAAMMQELNNRRTAIELAQTLARQGEFDAAYERGVTTGNWDLSTEETMRMGASLADSLRVAGQNTLQGIQYTDPVVFADLKDMATDPSTREAFLNLDLGDMLGSNQLNNSDYNTLRDLQRAVRDATSPEAEQSALVEALGGVDPQKIWNDARSVYEMEMGYDADPSDPSKMDDDHRQQVARFRRALERATIEATTAKGAPLTPMEQRALAYELMRPVEISKEGWLFGSSAVRVPTFDQEHLRAAGSPVQQVVIPFEDIPANVAEAMGSMLTDVPDGPRKIAAVERLYNDAELVRRGLTPTVTLEDIPPEIIATRTGQTQDPFIGMRWGEAQYEIDMGDGETLTVTEVELLDAYAETRRRQVLYMLGELDQLEGR